jgi:hypothetical protein
MDRVTIYDRLPLSGLHRDAQGNLIGVARAARTGIQVYAGYEIGRPELRSVRVWRPEAEVFSRDSMASYASVPVTIEHPSDPLVTPETWKDYAVGETEGDNIVRDGEVVKVPFIVRDAAAQAAIEDGKHEVSMGYGAMLDFTPGTVPDGQADAGTAYDAVQRGLRMNHLAIVDKARGGPTLRIGDSAPARESKVTTVTILLDGLSVETTEAGKQAIEKLMGERTALQSQVTDAQTQLGTLTADKARLEGEKVALEAQLADATSPAKLAAAATARATLISDAKRVVPNGQFDALDDAAIRRTVVEAKLGDTGKALADGPAIEGAFAAIVAAAPTQAPSSPLAPLTHAVTQDADVSSLAQARDEARAARERRFGNYGVDPQAKSA